MKSTKIIAGLGVAAALGVAAIPVASFAEGEPQPASSTVNLSATIASDLSLTIAEGGNSINFGNALSAGAASTAENATSVITVTTNWPNGYELTGKSTGDLAATGTTDKIAEFATASTISGEGAADGWGAHVAMKQGASFDNTSAFKDLTAGQYLGFNGATGRVIDKKAAKSGQVSNDYTVTYGLKAKANQASGTYTGTIPYTATAVSGS